MLGPWDAFYLKKQSLQNINVWAMYWLDVQYPRLTVTKFNEGFSDHFGRMGSLGITIMELCKQKAGWLVCDSGYQYYQFHWSYMICMNDQWSAVHCWENKMKLDGPEALIGYCCMTNSPDVFLQFLAYSTCLLFCCVHDSYMLHVSSYLFTHAFSSNAF